MPLFNWEEQKYCGDEPPTVCDPLDTAETVKAPHGTSLSGGCPVDLISPDHPALMVSLSDIQTELRSGSNARPIPIDLVKKSSSMAVPTLLFRDNAGTLTVWKPDNDCGEKKVVFESGAFRLKDDVNSNIFDHTCVGGYSDVEYIVGAREFYDCAGEKKMKLVFFPVAELPVLS